MWWHIQTILQDWDFGVWRSFNLALLSLQAWRVLHEPTSLSTRILKAVYFPSTSLLKAEMGPWPSQIWRAIIDGRDILTRGIISKNANGETTNIWTHNWILKEGMMRPLMLLTPNPPQLISELIDPTSATWREELVRQVFIPIDVEAILHIPLCTRRVDDFWAWQGDLERSVFCGLVLQIDYELETRKKVLHPNDAGVVSRPFLASWWISYSDEKSSLAAWKKEEGRWRWREPSMWNQVRLGD